jgi:hypothetical protein
MNDEEEDKIIPTDPILANKVNRFDSEFKFNEEDDLSGEDTGSEDLFALDSEDNEFSGGFQAPESDTESDSGEIN